MLNQCKPNFVRKVVVSFLVAVSAMFVFKFGMAEAEYADVVMNNYSDAEGMRPVVFPHWFHRIRFSCKVCHTDLGFKFEAGGNKIKMVHIIEGQFCGACHDGETAWTTENCDLCHSAPPGAITQVHGSTSQTLVTPITDQPMNKQKRKPKARVLD